MGDGLMIIKKFGNRPEGFEPSAVQAGKIREGSATCIRVLSGTKKTITPVGAKVNGGSR
jgi:hypothetical protein